MIFDKHGNLKYKFGNRYFWAEGYYVSTVGVNEATVAKYIQEQEKHDIVLDKLSTKEYKDTFRGQDKWYKYPLKGSYGTGNLLAMKTVESYTISIAD